MQLVIMAAGMGSRFGGLKQIAPMGPNDEFIIDYSIYDAIEAGFTKVIFIIKEENYEVFKETIGSRVEPHIPVEYVFQKMDNVPEFVKVPEDRVKPWGTGQAIYSAAKAATEKFIVINSDDYYGKDAYKVAAEFLKNSNSNQYATVGYKVINTMTENGSVKRGILAMEDGRLTKITESSIEKVDDKIIATPLGDEPPYEITEDPSVPMNMLAFDPSVFDYLKNEMDLFFKANENDLSKCEFLIPDVLSKANKENFAEVKVLDTNAVWYGVTYKEDTEYVRNAFAKMVEEGIYPKNLWK